jgi:hypothetical protein
MQNPSPDEIRRHRDGSIDFDFYRDQAAVHRRRRRNAAARQFGASIRRWGQSGVWIVAALVRVTRAMDRNMRAPRVSNPTSRS